MATKHYYTQDGIMLSELVFGRGTASWREFGGYPRDLFGVTIDKRPDGGFELADDTGGAYTIRPLDGRSLADYNAVASKHLRPTFDTIADARAAYKESLEDRCTIAPERADRFSLEP